MTRARWTLLAALAAALALAVAGCGGASKTTQMKELAIAAPGGAHDMGWSQQGVTAARTVARRLGIRAQVATGAGEQATPALERLAKSGASLLIAHGRRYAGAAVAVAARTKVPTLVFGDPRALQAGRVGDVEVAAEQGGYLAGYIAARASYIPSVGIVVASDDPYWYRTAGGFIAGARRFDPHVRISYTALHGADDDVAGSEQAAERQIAGKTQMIIGLGERATLGVMHATQHALYARGARHFDAMFVDVVGDKSAAGLRALSGLTAVLWNFAPAYRQAIADLRAGRFGRRPYTLSLANGGITLMHDGRTPSDNYEAALALGRQIAAGRIAVPVTTTDAAVRALLRAPPAS